MPDNQSDPHRKQAFHQKPVFGPGTGLGSPFLDLDVKHTPGFVGKD